MTTVPPTRCEHKPNENASQTFLQIKLYPLLIISPPPPSLKSCKWKKEMKRKKEMIVFINLTCSLMPQRHHATEPKCWYHWLDGGGESNQTHPVVKVVGCETRSWGDALQRLVPSAVTWSFHPPVSKPSCLTGRDTGTVLSLDLRLNVSFLRRVISPLVPQKDELQGEPSNSIWQPFFF